MDKPRNGAGPIKQTRFVHRVRDNFDESWERIKKVTGWKRYAELERFLGITAGSTQGAKKRNNMPLGWLCKVAAVHAVRLDWMIKGIEPMYLDDPNASGDPSSTALSSPVESDFQMTPEIKPVYDALMEVLDSDEVNTINALAGLIYELRDKVRLQQDMDSIRRRLFDKPKPTKVSPDDTEAPSPGSL